MSLPQIERPDLPEYLTWAELQRLPAKIADQIELRDGRVQWVRRDPRAQTISARLVSALERGARQSKSAHAEQSGRVSTGTSLFLGHDGKSDFLTPGFLVHRCLESPCQDLRSADVLLAGEILSPAIGFDAVARRGRYEEARIPWYWEVILTQEADAIATVRAWVLRIGPYSLPEGVQPLRPANYTSTRQAAVFRGQ